MKKINASCYMCYVLMILVATACNNRFAVTQRNFGVSANSPEDQTANIQKYLDYVASRGGGQATLGPGYYTIKGSLTIPTGVCLTGSWEMPHHGIVSKGTILHAYAGRGRETGPALLEMKQSTGVTGLTILYPEQTLKNVQPYPWSIHGVGMYNTIENITFVNTYQGVCIGPERNESHQIRNVVGCALRKGVLIDHTTDTGRIENVHFNPHFWQRSGDDGVLESQDPLNIYVHEHLEAFTFARTDWEYVHNTSLCGAKIGYRFIKNPETGACNGQFDGIGADMCQICVLVDDAQPWGIIISNGEFVANQYKADAIYDKVGICTSPRFDGVLQLSNCSFWGNFTNVMRFDGEGFVSVSQASIINWTPIKAEIDILGGRASIGNVLFDDRGTRKKIDAPGPHFRVGENVKRAVISDNFAEGGIKITNNAGSRLVSRNNE